MMGLYSFVCVNVLAAVVRDQLVNDVSQVVGTSTSESSKMGKTVEAKRTEKIEKSGKVESTTTSESSKNGKKAERTEMIEKSRKMDPPS